MIRIDGSYGEGGGQILRSSVALSMCTGKPIAVTRIRAKRKKPGLMRQHLTAVRAAQTICGATVKGAELRSGALTFEPGAVKAGDYHFAVGTAGSATLVLQTILPALMTAKGTSTITVEGGTHNPWSPPFHFLKHSFMTVMKTMGVSCDAVLDVWGFFPAGGGKITVTIDPSKGRLKPIDLLDRGERLHSHVLTAISKVPFAVADDESKLIINQLDFPVDKREPIEVNSPGPGNVALLDVQFENVREVFTGFGQQGVSRKAVARKVAKEANRYWNAKVAVGEYLADQLLIPMALAGGGSFTTVKPTLHTRTNVEVIQTFMDIRFVCEQLDRTRWKVVAG